VRDLAPRRDRFALHCGREETTVGVVFIPWHFHEAAANLLTNDALDPEAKIPEFKACAVQVFPARER
jgi:predicted molibdopterin-dependent oxidoreductase YjgC